MFKGLTRPRLSLALSIAALVFLCSSQCFSQTSHSDALTGVVTDRSGAVIDGATATNPVTYKLDGNQYLVGACGTTFVAFALP
jgi:hypothetical protein